MNKFFSHFRFGFCFYRYTHMRIPAHIPAHIPARTTSRTRRPTGCSSNAAVRPQHTTVSSIPATSSTSTSRTHMPPSRSTRLCLFSMSLPPRTAQSTDLRSMSGHRYNRNSTYHHYLLRRLVNTARKSTPTA